MRGRKRRAESDTDFAAVDFTGEARRRRRLPDIITFIPPHFCLSVCRCLVSNQLSPHPAGHG